MYRLAGNLKLHSEGLEIIVVWNILIHTGSDLLLGLFAIFLSPFLILRFLGDSFLSK